MCIFFSGIIKPKHAGVWYDLDLDHHSEIMEKFKIKDDKHPANFVKFEIVPKDSDVFNHNRENWAYKLDQDTTPDWYDEERAADQAWNALQNVFSERFLIDVDDVRTIKEGRWFCKNSKISMLGGTLESMLGGTLEYMEGGTLEYMQGGTLKSMLGGTLKSMLGGTLEYMEGGTLEYMQGGTLESMLGGTLISMLGGTLKSMLGGTLEYMEGGTLEYMEGGTLEKQTGTAIRYDGFKIIVADKRFAMEYL